MTTKRLSRWSTTYLFLAVVYLAKEASAFSPSLFIGGKTSTSGRSQSHHARHEQPTIVFSSSNNNEEVNNIEDILGIEIKDLNGVDSSTASKSGERTDAKPRVGMDTLPMHTSVSGDAGPLWKEELCDDPTLCTVIPHRGRFRKRVLILCTGGTLTMSNDPTKGNSLAPVQGALTSYLAGMSELTDDPEMPEISHEYKPLIDSSDMGPGDWAMLARDINTNYYYFDGFVVLMGTDTMAYAASALSFMLQNLGKPVIFTGSQIPLREPYNDARKNLIMATIFASSDTMSEVCIFFHDRLVRGCRATKVNTSKLKAFDSPNLAPLAEIGINIEENDHLFRPPPRVSEVRDLMTVDLRGELTPESELPPPPLASTYQKAIAKRNRSRRY